jgi:peroxiredoxin
MRRVAIIGLSLISAFGGLRVIPHSGALQESAKGQSPSPAAAYQVLIREWERASEEFANAYIAAETADAREKLRAANPAPDFQHRFMDLIRKHPGETVAIDAIAWIFQNFEPGPQAERDVHECIDILAGHHLKGDRLSRALPILGTPLGTERGVGCYNEEAEKLLRAALATSPHRTVRGQACFSLASYLRFHARHRSAGMSEDQAAAWTKESEALFERVTRDYADVAAPEPYRATLGELAEGRLFELRSLEIGRPAPEIEGKDLDGAPMTLSAFRGKVVVLCFCGNWCGTCKAMYPHHRRLVDRLKDKPFVFLGVNTDKDRETLRGSIRAGEVTWRCFWDGGFDGPITVKWGVRVFPTLYVIDAAGVIRARNVYGAELDETVDMLLEATQPAKSP